VVTERLIASRWRVQTNSGERQWGAALTLEKVLYEVVGRIVQQIDFGLRNL